MHLQYHKLSIQLVSTNDRFLRQRIKFSDEKPISENMHCCPFHDVLPHKLTEETANKSMIEEIRRIGLYNVSSPSLSFSPLLETIEFVSPQSIFFREFTNRFFDGFS